MPTSAKNHDCDCDQVHPEFLNQSLGAIVLFSVRFAVSVNVFLLGGTMGFLDWPVMKLSKTSIPNPNRY